MICILTIFDRIQIDVNTNLKVKSSQVRNVIRGSSEVNLSRDFVDSNTNFCIKCPSKIKGGQISEVRVVKYVKGNCVIVCLKENFNRGRNTKSEISDWDVEVIGYERDRNDIMCEYEAK